VDDACNTIFTVRLTSPTAEKIGISANEQYLKMTTDDIMLEVNLFSCCCK